MNEFVDKSTTTRPLVSVVIPTFLRPQFVTRAVGSVLLQTMKSLEVVVVVAGRDHETIKALKVIKDPRLRIHVPDRQMTGSQARNVGVELSHGTWVAFLDDDDYWMTDKLQRQLQVAEAMESRYPVISCRLIARAESDDFVWPRRYPRANEPLCEYLFRRRSPFYGEGLLQTSTLLAKRELLQTIPFDEHLNRFDDLDWILRIHNLSGVDVAFPTMPDPLVVWHIDRSRVRASNGGCWRMAIRWIRSHEHRVSRRAFSGFLLCDTSAIAGRQGDWTAFWPLWREALRGGRPDLMQILNHFANYLTPLRLRHLTACWVALFRRRAVLSSTNVT